MRPIDSSYDTACAGFQSSDLGRREYALVSDHNGPCSEVGEYASIEAAIEAARTMDTDAAPSEMGDVLDYDGRDDRDDSGLIGAAQAQGWRIVAFAPAGEYWTVLVHDEAGL